MKDIEQRIAIADACGWAGIKNANTMAAQGVWVGYNPKLSIIGKPEYLPDYLHDLNAMNDAYLHLVSISQPYSAKRQPDVMFNLILMEIMNPDKKLWDNGTFLGSVFDGLKTTNATAAQRAEAFLKTLGLWKD